MSASEQSAAISRDRDGVINSMIEAWACISLLRGISEAGKAGLVGARLSCAYAFNRATFSALYSCMGTILDSDDGVHSLPRMMKRLESLWAKNPELLSVIDDVKAAIAADHTAEKLKAWRNKAIAHRTPKSIDNEFYAENQVSVEEIACTLTLLEDQLNVLSVNFDGVISYGHQSAARVIPRDVVEIFGAGT
jgi:hypothetical protein